MRVLFFSPEPALSPGTVPSSFSGPVADVFHVLENGDPHDSVLQEDSTVMVFTRIERASLENLPAVFPGPLFIERREVHRLYPAPLRFSLLSHLSLADAHVANLRYTLLSPEMGLPVSKTAASVAPCFISSGRGMRSSCQSRKQASHRRISGRLWLSGISLVSLHEECFSSLSAEKPLSAARSWPRIWRFEGTVCDGPPSLGTWSGRLGASVDSRASHGSCMSQRYDLQAACS